MTNSQLRSRRFVLKLLACGGAGAWLAACGGGSSSTVAVSPTGQTSFPQGVFSGDPTSMGAVLSTRALPSSSTASFSVQLQVSSSPTFDSVLQEFPLTARQSAGDNYRLDPGDYIIRQVVEDLAPAQSYFYRFVGPEGSTSPIGSFRTLGASGDGRSFRFLHISCANEPPFTVARGMLQEGEVDFICFNGDTVYADRYWLDLLPTESLDFYRSLYRDQRDPNYAGEEFPQLFLRTAFVINWDDHEVIDNYSGQGDAGGSATQLDDTTGQTDDVESLQLLGYQAFYEYNPITPQLTDVSGVNSQDRLFRSFRDGNAEFFVLDLRQYRDLSVFTPVLPVLPPGLTQEEFLALAGLTELPPEQLEVLFGPPGSEAALRALLRETPRTLMGEPQKSWFLDGLRNSTATWKFVINEFPITETFFRANDVWEGYWLERQEVLSFIESNNIQNVVFLTGNNHSGFIGRVNPGQDPPIWEVWTGPTGNSVTANDIDEEGEALGLPGRASELYYQVLNGFLAPVNSAVPELGGIPGVTLSSLFFLELAKPNYTSVDVSGSQVIIQLKDADGNLLIDPLGRRGELILPRD